MQKSLLTNKEAYIMELEQTCICKPFHGVDHLANGKLFVTATLRVMVGQKLPRAALCNIRKGNGLGFTQVQMWPSSLLLITPLPMSRLCKTFPWTCTRAGCISLFCVIVVCSFTVLFLFVCHDDHLLPKSACFHNISFLVLLQSSPLLNKTHTECCSANAIYNDQCFQFIFSMFFHVISCIYFLDKYIFGALLCHQQWALQHPYFQRYWLEVFGNNRFNKLSNIRKHYV